MALESAAAVIEQIRRPVVNPPAPVLRTGRDEVYRRLHEIPGLRCPKTVRLFPEHVSDIGELLTAGEGGAARPPFLVREAGTHGSTKLELVSTEADLPRLDRFAFDGRAFYLIEFVDYRSADGLYRKYRAVVIGGRLFLRHLITSDSWKVHSRSRRGVMAQSTELRDEEVRALESFDPGEHPRFGRIWAELELDYFGVDHGYDLDGNMVVFEVNCCFRPLVLGEALEQHHHDRVAAMRAAFTELVWERAGRVPVV
ncbi:MAG: hypothetical protein ACRD0G_12450 [Acidimicrobiales bacterium]